MNGIADVIWLIIHLLTLAIILRAVLSWFMVNPRGGFLVSLYQVLHQITEPILAPLRRIIPPIGGFDLTPIVAIILLQIIGEIFSRALS